MYLEIKLAILIKQTPVTTCHRKKRASSATNKKESLTPKPKKRLRTFITHNKPEKTLNNILKHVPPIVTSQSNPIYVSDVNISDNESDNKSECSLDLHDNYSELKPKQIKQLTQLTSDISGI